MKNGFLLFLLFAAATSARGQRITHVEVSGDRLDVTCEIPLQRPRSDYAMVITPLLCHGRDTVPAGTPIVVRGRRNARKWHRDYVLGGRQGTQLPYVKAGQAAQPVTRTVSLSLTGHSDAEPLTLCLRTEEEGCCRVQTLPTRCSEQVAYVLPRPVAAPVAETPAPESELTKLIETNPVLQPIEHYQAYDPSKPLDRNSDVMPVFYPVGSTVLRGDFAGNAATLDSIVYITRLLQADEFRTVRKIQIVGFASIEGDAALNHRIAGRRAEALKRYVQQHTGVSDELFEVVNGGEAWADFRAQVAAGDADIREALLDIIDNEPQAARRKQRIRQHNGGRTYRRLVQGVLKQQRNAGFIRIYYGTK